MWQRWPSKSIVCARFAPLPLLKLVVRREMLEINASCSEAALYKLCARWLAMPCELRCRQPLAAPEQLWLALLHFLLAADAAASSTSRLYDVDLSAAQLFVRALCGVASAMWARAPRSAPPFKRFVLGRLHEATDEVQLLGVCSPCFACATVCQSSGCLRCRTRDTACTPCLPRSQTAPYVRLRGFCLPNLAHPLNACS